MEVMPLAALVLAAIFALSSHGVAGGLCPDTTRQDVPLTAEIPPFVTKVCNSPRRSPIRLVCPPLVPVSKYVRIDGLYGAFIAAVVEPRTTSPRRLLYFVSFNHGDNGPGFIHWVAGMGTEEAVRYWVLSDARNIVRGKPKLARVVSRMGRRVEIWRFPEHPAGGQFGGHIVAIRAKSLFAIASIHGYDATDASAQMAVALARKSEKAR